MKFKIFGYFYFLIGLFFRIINFRKPKILIYTDSRGFDVKGSMGKNPLNSYVEKFLRNYNVDFFICEEKHTTILDFLEKKKSNDYKYTILHCGVVDFSPRPISNLNFVLNSKRSNNLFRIALEKYGDYYNNSSSVMYMGERTQNLYSKSFLNEVVIPRLQKIHNLIWINSNHFVRDWDGNYTKGRPKNIEEYVCSFDVVLMSNLKNIVDLKCWNDDEIKKYTIDNIHFNEEGFHEVFRMINEKILEISANQK